jgi:PEP-CTERM motif
VRNLWFLCLAFAVPGVCQADTAFLQSSADTTLIGIAPDNNLGAAGFFNSGINGRGYESRGLFSFDFGSIPPGSRITSASLTLEVVREPVETSSSSYFAFYRVLRPWGEGTKTHDGTPSLPINPGLGNLATDGDATWNDRFYGGAAPWAAPGGAPGIDFASTISAEMPIGGIFESPYTLANDPGIGGDIQFWIDHPEANFGWMFITEGTDIRNARSFASREDLLGRGPLLVIDYTPVPEPASWMFLSGGALGLFWTVFRRKR